MLQRQFEIINDRSCMLIALPQIDDSIAYQVKMLEARDEKEHITGILPLSILRRDGIAYLVYDITGKMPLTLACEQGRISVQVFCNVLLALLDIPNHLRGYMLSFAGIQLDMEMIYAEVRGSAPQFIFVPTMDECVPLEKVVAFARAQISQDMVQLDRPGFADVIFSATRNSALTTAQFASMLAPFAMERQPSSLAETRQPVSPEPSSHSYAPVPERNNEPIRHQEAAQALRPQADTAPAKATPAPPLPVQTGGKAAGSMPAPSLPSHPAGGPKLPFSLAGRASTAVAQPPIPKPQGSLKRLLMLLFLALGVIALLVLLAFSGILYRKDGSLDLVKCGGTLVLGVLVFFLGYRGLPKPSQDSSPTDIDRDSSEGGNQSATGASNAGSGLRPSAPKVRDYVPPPPQVPPASRPNSVVPHSPVPQRDHGSSAQPLGATSLIPSSGGMPMRTELLGSVASTVEEYVLESASDGRMYDLPQFPCRIGRDPEAVHCVLSTRESTIGRFHAQIEQHEGQFYIIDMNSVNKTYVNDFLVTPSVATPIQLGDRIRFAKAAFVFRRK